MTSPAHEQGHLCLKHVPGEARMKEVAERAAGEKEREGSEATARRKILSFEDSWLSELS